MSPIYIIADRREEHTNSSFLGIWHKNNNHWLTGNLCSELSVFKEKYLPMVLMCSCFKSYIVILIFKVLMLLNKYCLFCHLFINNYGVSLIIGSYIINSANTALTEKRPQSSQRRNPSMLCEFLCVSFYSYIPSLNNYVHFLLQR